MSKEMALRKAKAGSVATMYTLTDEKVKELKEDLQKWRKWSAEESPTSRAGAYYYGKAHGIKRVLGAMEKEKS